MRKPAMKAFFTLLTLGKGGGTRPNWERWIAIFSTSVTIGLIAIYVWEKTVARW